MKPRLQLVSFSLAVLLAAAGCTRYGGGTLPSGALETAPAQVGALTATVGATGTVRPEQLGALTFKTSGTVDRVLVQVGDSVRAGDRLAELSDATLPASVLMARADLVAAQKALEDLKTSNLAAAQAQVALANAREELRQATYRRDVNQAGQRANKETIANAKARLVLAQAEVDQAQDAYSNVSDLPSDDPARALARTKLAAARQARDSALRSLNWYNGKPSDIEQAQLDANVAIAQAHVDDAQREVDRLANGPDPRDIAAAEARVAAAQATVALAWIEAPFSGTITAAEVHPGDQVAPGTPALQLADLEPLLVDVNVSEVDINRVKPGQAAELTFDAILDKTYQGTVKEVDLVGTETQGAVNFLVTVAITNPDELVRPGLTAAVTLVVDQIENALLVPNRAVRVVNGERVVYVMRDGKMTAVPIVLGTSSDTNSQVVQGELAAGDTIVLNPPVVIDTTGGPPRGLFGR